MSTSESIEVNEELNKWILENLEWLSLLHDLHKQRGKEHEQSNGKIKQQPNCS